jgi:hypothetical protein
VRKSPAGFLPPFFIAAVIPLSIEAQDSLPLFEKARFAAIR